MGYTQYLPLIERKLHTGSFVYRIVQHELRSGTELFNTRAGSKCVAIVGLSGRFPGAGSVEEFWKNLLNGQDFVKESRFNLEEFYDASHKKKNSTAARHGAFLNAPGMFDHRLFNMSPREAAQIDPLQRLFLTTAYEALESSGYHPDATLSTNRNRTNTYFGQCSDDWRDTLPGSDLGTDIYYIPGISRAFVPREGIGVVILKRLEDAVADNDNVLAVIRGAARTYSNTATSMTHPSSEAQERLYRQVLLQANMAPNDVSFIEMHGTGTQAGDFAEMSSVLNTFAINRSRDNPLVVGAVKANIGHGESTHDPRSFHVISISGKTQKAIFDNKKRLLSYLKNHPKTKLADLAYTTTARRMHQSLRECFTGQSTTEILQQIDASIKSQRSTPSTGTGNIAFVFTGQGSQYAGMGRDLYETHTEFRSLLEKYDSLATNQGLPSFLRLIRDNSLDITSQSPAVAQMALVAIEVAMVSLWDSWGIRPDVVIGHSLGEYAALCVAGVFSVSDMLYLVGTRAAMLEDKLTAGAYAMLVIRAGPKEVQQALVINGFNSCQIALQNSPNITVVSGLMADIDNFRAYLAQI
ncbi:hypothetical protein DV737_g1684, partial [Chaetothyriales sp. CBS 132003]